MVDCAPSKLLSDIHYRLPHLSHVRFGGNFTDDSLSETLPGEIVVRFNTVTNLLNKECMERLI